VSDNVKKRFETDIYICIYTNNVKHTTLCLSIRKYGRNSSVIVKLTAYPLTPVMKDSKLYPFAVTTEAKPFYTGLHSP